MQFNTEREHMETIIKIDLQSKIKNKEIIVLELGAGEHKTENRINIDILNLSTVDIVADLENGLPFLPDNSVDEIYSNSFLEHINDLDKLMMEIWRVLKHDGFIKIFVPHFSNPYYYSDYTHKSFFGLYTFEYFMPENNKTFKRDVPRFYENKKLNTEEIKFVFKSHWKVRNLLKKIIQGIINSNKYMMEFYEENLCYIFPCYGIKVKLKPIK